MVAHQLSYNDFLRIVRACGLVHMSALPRSFDLKSYLVQVLRPRCPDIAFRLAGMSADEVDVLRGEIAERQGMVV